jgi:hypothetical protein
MIVPKSVVIGAMTLFVTSTAVLAETSKTVTDFSGEIQNACNGDTIALTGRTMTIISSSVSNGSHLLQMSLTWFRGTGVSGDTYVGRTKDSFLSNIAFGSELTQIIDTNLISQGSSPNFILRQLLHITVTPNGDITSDVLNMYTICTP